MAAHRKPTLQPAEQPEELWHADIYFAQVVVQGNFVVGADKGEVVSNGKGRGAGKGPTQRTAGRLARLRV